MIQYEDTVQSKVHWATSLKKYPTPPPVRYFVSGYERTGGNDKNLHRRTVPLSCGSCTRRRRAAPRDSGLREHLLTKHRVLNAVRYHAGRNDTERMFSASYSRGSRGETRPTEYFGPFQSPRLRANGCLPAGRSSRFLSVGGKPQKDATSSRSGCPLPVRQPLANGGVLRVWAGAAAADWCE